MIFVSLNKKLNKKVLLLILDGWGIADNKDASAPDKADTPNFNSLIENYPNNFLITHGEKVGLPKGQMGNSEVGHMNIGSGRIVLQDLLKINNSIKEGVFRNKTHFNDIKGMDADEIKDEFDNFVSVNYDFLDEGVEWFKKIAGVK